TRELMGGTSGSEDVRGQAKFARRGLRLESRTHADHQSSPIVWREAAEQLTLPAEQERQPALALQWNTEADGAGEGGCAADVGRRATRCEVDPEITGRAAHGLKTDRTALTAIDRFQEHLCEPEMSLVV